MIQTHFQVKPCVRVVKVARVLGWRHRHVTRNVIATGRRAGVALASTIMNNPDDPVVDHAIASLAATAHVSHDVMHASLKFVLAFLAVFVTL